MSAYESFHGLGLPASSSFKLSMEPASSNSPISSLIKGAESLLIDMFVGTFHNSQLPQYNQLIRAILKEAPAASDKDFQIIQTFTAKIKNQTFNDHLEAIQVMRKEESLESCLRHLTIYKETLLEAFERSKSNQGLPWEPYALGTSIGHQLSEKRSLLNILSTSLSLIKNCLFWSSISSPPSFSKVEKEVEESIKMQRIQLQKLNKCSVTLSEAERRVYNPDTKKWTLADWNQPLCQNIYGLVKEYEDEIFDLDPVSQTLKNSYPSFSQLLDKLATSDTTLSLSEKEMLLLFLRAAEKEDFISKLMEQRASCNNEESSNPATQLYKQIGRYLSDACKALESISLPNLREIGQQILHCIKQMNVLPPSSEPNWQRVIQKNGYRLKKIGTGKQGIVWKATNQTSTARFKRKNFLIKSFTDPDSESLSNWYRGLYGERTARVIHPNLLHIQGAFLSSSAVQAVILSGESSNQMNLFNFLAIQTSLSRQQRYEIGRQLVQGVQALHVSNRIHKDLKPENVLVRKEGNSYTIVIIDPGFQEKLTAWKPLSSRCCGSQRYIAPEVAEKILHGKEADIYSLGSLLYAIFTGYNFSINVESKDFFKDYPDQLEKLILSMLSKNPTHRPVIRDIARLYFNLQDLIT